MDSTEFTAELRMALGDLRVDSIGRDAFRVIVPSLRQQHESLVLSVERDDEGAWVISDAGSLAFLLEDEFASTVETIQCAGASFDVEGDYLVQRVADQANLPSSVLSFAHYVASAPAIWHALECQRRDAGDAAPKKITSTVLMAREARGDLSARVGQRSRSLVHIDYRVGGRGRRTTAPFALLPPGSQLPPRLIASFIDTTVDPRSVTAAERLTSFLLDVTGEQTMPKFVVVRGESRDVDDYRHIYEHERAVVLSSEDRSVFIDQAAGIAREILGTAV